VRDSLTGDFEVRPATAVDPDSPLVITPRVTLSAVGIPVLAKHQNSATGVGFTVRTATIRTTADDKRVAAPASAEPSAVSGGIPDAPVIVITPIVITPIIITSITITSIITAGGSAILAPAPPLQIKGITFTASPVILNSDYGNASVLPGIANQRDMSPAIDSGETEIVGVRGHGLIALHPAPFGRLPRHGDQASLGTGNLHHGHIVHIHFDGAFTATTTPGDGRSEIPLHLSWRGDCGKNQEHCGD